VGQSPGGSKVSLVGVRSPPLRGGAIQGQIALRGKTGITRSVVFSEGCALRVRVGRPYVCRGITYSWEANEARWPRGHMPRSSASVPSGRAEPAPPRGGQARVGWANGENPEITRGAIFSEGRGLRARKCRPRGSRGMDLCTSTQHFSRPGVRP
jgi:hypothetical protein